MSTPTSAELKVALLRELIRRVDEGERVLPKGAERPVTVSAPASTLTAAVAFLRAFPPEDEDKGQPLQPGDLMKRLERYKGVTGSA